MEDPFSQLGNDRMKLPEDKLCDLRDKLRAQGARPSLVFPVARPDVADALEIVHEFGPLCEVLYLMMAADKRVLQVEREVMRGGLEIVAGGRVRSAHMESMLDASAKRVARLGEQACLASCIDALRGKVALSEIAVVLAAAIAVADNRVVAEEHALLAQLVEGLGLDEDRVSFLIGEMLADHIPASP